MIERFRIDYLRDGLVEEFHTGVVQCGFSSKYLEPYYLRSCAKPLQASLLIDYKIDFTEEELAFCSGSHAGEDCHIKIANQILNKLELDKSYLKCGEHAPLSKTMQSKMILNNDQYLFNYYTEKIVRMTEEIKASGNEGKIGVFGVNLKEMSNKMTQII